MKRRQRSKDAAILARRSTALVPARADRLLGDIRGMIESARSRAAQFVNVELVMLYWRIGVRIRGDIIGPGRAAYGEQIVHALSAQLTAEYGHGLIRPARARLSDRQEPEP